jgi:hypothetical protein
MNHIRALTAGGTSSGSVRRSCKGKPRQGLPQADVAKHVDLPVTNNPCPYIIAELLLTSRMDYTIRILLSLLVLVMNIDAVSTDTYLICKVR